MQLPLLKKIENSIAGIVCINVILAIVAIVRDIILASYLGTTADSDALLLAFFYPDVFGNNLIAAAIGIACIPILTDIYISHDEDSFNNSVKSISLLVFLGCFTLVMVSYVFRSDIINLLGVGLKLSTKNASADILAIILPAIMIFPLISIGSSLSNIHGSFKIPAITPILFNVVYMVGIVCCSLFNIPKSKAVNIIAVYIILGVLMMFIVVWINILKNKWIQLRKSTGKFFKINELKAFIRILAPYIIILFSFQIVFYVERYLASMSASGTLTGLNFAYRVSQLPIWIFIAAISTTTLPVISRMNGMKQNGELKVNIVKFLKLTLLILLPLAIIINILRVPIINILFKGGAFDNDSIMITSSILAGYSVAIIGQGVFVIGVRYFMVLKYMTLPTIVVIIASAVNITADLILFELYGPAGIGIGAALGSVCCGVSLVVLINRRLKLGLFAKLRTGLKILAANIPVLILSLFYKELWNKMPDNANKLLELAYGLTAGFTCLSVYLGCLFLFRVETVIKSKYAFINNIIRKRVAS